MTCRLFALLFAALAFAPAWAQVADPTQPPAALQAPAAPDQAAPAPVDQAPVLQSVLISPKRRVAVIDGVTVRQGQRFHGALVSQVNEKEVILVRDNHKQVLKLFSKGEPEASGPEKRKTE